MNIQQKLLALIVLLIYSFSLLVLMGYVKDVLIIIISLLGFYSLLCLWGILYRKS